MQLLRLRDVTKATGLARSTIYAHMAEGTFPRPLKVGSVGVRWDLADLEKWKSSLPVANDNHNAAR